MEDNKIKIIDLEQVIPVLIKGWKHYAIAFVCSILFSLVFIFTIPRYYSCQIKLAPESTNINDLSSKMNSLGMTAPIKTEDAISPMLYPELMESNDFITSLFTMNIITKDGTVETDYCDYIKNRQKHSWYMNCLLSITKLIATQDTTAVNPKYSASFMPTKEQDRVAEIIRNQISFQYDKKTGVVSVTVKDQDPLVCALVADTISSRLQDFITDYRTKKSRNNLEYAERIYATTRMEYEVANAQYAAEVDANLNAAKESIKSQIEKLANEKSLKFQALSAASQRLQLSRAKLQEDTPVITMLQGASVPVKPAGPKRMIITLALILASFIIVTARIVIKNKA